MKRYLLGVRVVFCIHIFFNYWSLSGGNSVSSNIADERAHAVHTYYDLPVLTDIVMSPLELVVWWRFDLMAKYIYALHYMKGVESRWGYNLYAAHQLVWSNAVEWDGSRVSIQEYLTDFHEVIASIKKYGFNPKKSRIRIDRRKFPCEGSHRIVAALLCNEPVVCYYDNNPYRNGAVQSTATFFKEYDRYVSGGLADCYLDDMALAYCQLKPNARLIVLEGFSDVINVVKNNIRMHANVVYHTSKIIRAGFDMLPMVITGNAIGDSNNGMTINLDTISVEVLLVEPRYENSMRAIIDLLEEAMTYGYNVHFLCSDHLDTQYYAQFFYNNNSLYYGNRQFRFSPLYCLNDLIAAFKQWCISCGVDSNDFCVAAVQWGKSGNKHPIKTFMDAHITSAGRINDSPLLIFYYHGLLLPSYDQAMFRMIAGKHNDESIYNPHCFFYYNGLKWAC